MKLPVKIPSNIWHTYAVMWVRIWGVKGRHTEKKLTKEMQFLRAAAGRGVRNH